MGKWNPMKQAFDPAPATVADFLLARIDEDGAAARDALQRGFGGWEWLADLGVNFEARTHIARWDPARVLAECEAKRRIVERAQSAARWAATEGEADYADDGREYAGAVADAWQEALLALALPYAGHPDWREEWRP